MSRAKSSVAFGLAALIAKALAVAFALATPFLGVWVASSLAAFSNWRTHLVVISGALLFPLLPLAWEFVAAIRRKAGSPRFLTFADRLVLRTLAINLVFLGALLAVRPEQSFIALATRGDWMLDGRHSANAEKARGVLLAAANKLEWLYRAAHKNPYADSEATRTQEKPTESSTPEKEPTTEREQPKATTTEPKKPAWPFAQTLHPIVREIPPSEEASIESVARYIASREKNPTLRVKALHDYVVDRIAYDWPAYEGYKRGERIPQASAEAEPVFRNKRGVCAGYAQLMVALGKVTGDEIVYVTGTARGEAFGVEGTPHAWNAVKIEGKWHLIDATWNRPTRSSAPEEKTYRTEYFFTPPEAFGMDHLPDDDAWQLRYPRITKSEFFRQPMLSPSFYAKGLEMISPRQAQVDAHGTIDLEVRNPHRVAFLTDVVVDGQHEGRDCNVTLGEITRIRCTMSAENRYVIRLFARQGSGSTYDLDAQVQVNNRRN